mmetsp:Transcript_11427/g.28946  ORF Transcript_11427/g.28946 Transcript_11427/m.28946 type:complete len:373 (+) Transcript_11427:1169-2287(+)
MCSSASGRCCGSSKVRSSSQLGSSVAKTTADCQTEPARKTRAYGSERPFESPALRPRAPTRRTLSVARGSASRARSAGLHLAAVGAPVRPEEGGLRCASSCRATSGRSSELVARARGEASSAARRRSSMLLVRTRRRSAPAGPSPDPSGCVSSTHWPCSALAAPLVPARCNTFSAESTASPTCACEPTALQLQRSTCKPPKERGSGKEPAPSRQSGSSVPLATSVRALCSLTASLPSASSRMKTSAKRSLEPLSWWLAASPRPSSTCTSSTHSRCAAPSVALGLANPCVDSVEPKMPRALRGLRCASRERPRRSAASSAAVLLRKAVLLRRSAAAAPLASKSAKWAVPTSPWLPRNESMSAPNSASTSCASE